MIKFFLLLGLVFMGISACKQRQTETVFVLRTSDQTGIDFSNTIVENDSVNLLDYEYVYNGGGVAVLDFNGDALPDLFFSGNMVPSKLYLNQGGLKFKDVSASAGITKNNWATGVAVADVNADGLPDIYVCSAGNVDEEARANLLYINNGDSTFTESAASYGLADTGYTTMAAFLDYDRDNDLDLYVVTFANETWNTNIIYPKVTDGSGKGTDRLYRNNGNNTFTDVSREANILIEGYGLGVAICDINRDAWPDIYVSNDYIDDDFLYLNNQDGTFTESAATLLNHISHFGMGNDLADINNDGNADIVVVDMEPDDHARQKLFSMPKNYDKLEMTLKMGYMPAYMRNTLQLNNGNGSFSEIGSLAGIHHTDWSWAPLLADFDNDGFKDFFVTNGYPKDIMNRDFMVYNKYANSFQAVNTPPSLEEQHRFTLQAINELEGSKVVNYIYKNNGDLTFTNKSSDWGFEQPSFSNGAIYADLDTDGDLDLVVNNINDPAFVYENQSKPDGTNNYLRLKLAGDSMNRFALGATVELYAGNNGLQHLENSPYRGFQSTVEPVLHFGIGASAVVDSVVVKWPDGKYTVLKAVQANQLVTIHHDDAVSRNAVLRKKKAPLFKNVTEHLGIKYVHEEIEHDDFKVQPLLPHKFSQSGPGIAVADVNADGLSDFYVGGAQQFSGGLYIQTSDGRFNRRTFEHHYANEDLGVLFFDADNDGDADLYVVSGGSEQMAGVSYYQDRLYLNDGQGNFTHDRSALPKMFDSGSCVVAGDFDGDGDLDLFVGGAIHPGRYPLPPRSFLLRNDKGKFSDVTDTLTDGSFARMGLVTAALWTDFDNNGTLDLMVTGEWMPLTVFKNAGDRFTPVTRALGLNQTTGWWNSIASGDFDNDGDTDYVAGNTGRNSRYKPSEKEPLVMYTKDFDQNGTVEGILTYYIQGRQQVVHSRDEMTEQINFLRKRFPRYDLFAKAKFSDVLTDEELNGAYVLKCTSFESVYLQNEGGKAFSIKPLPLEAQFAPLFGMTAIDADYDGNLDLIAVGNSYSPELSVGRYDASFGSVLKGDGKGGFKAMPANESGVFVRGDAKGLATLFNAQGEMLLLVSKNAGPLEAFVHEDSTGKTITLQRMDAWAEFTFSNGTKRKQEFYYGNTYLSHSQRRILVPDQTVKITIYSFSGVSRILRYPF